MYGTPSPFPGLTLEMMEHASRVDAARRNPDGPEAEEFRREAAVLRSISRESARRVAEAQAVREKQRLRDEAIEGALTSRLRSADTASEVADVIAGDPFHVCPWEARVAWKRLTDRGSVEPTHDIATVSGEEHLFLAWRWYETGSRRDAWYANGYPPRFLDREGVVWEALTYRTAPDVAVAPKWSVVLPRGGRFREVVLSTEGRLRWLRSGCAVVPKYLESWEYANALSYALRPCFASFRPDEWALARKGS